MAQAVISTIGHDRPGLVSAITAVAKEYGLNIADSRMTVLGGEFAVLMSVQGSDTALQAFHQAMDVLCADDDLAYVFRLTGERQNLAPSRRYVATFVAMDHPGIVHSIAEFFSSRQINIHDLQTTTTPAAHTGTPIFSVTLTAEVPAGLRVHELREQFEHFCVDTDLDGQLEAAR
ncbi:MAG: ACT domain-containing protein [Pseudomonadota bacterium]